jgi:hypothetical protein
MGTLWSIDRSGNVKDLVGNLAADVPPELMADEAEAGYGPQRVGSAPSVTGWDIAVTASTFAQREVAE